MGIRQLTDSAGGFSNGMDTQSLYDEMIKRQDEQIARDAEESRLDREAAARKDAIYAKSQYNEDLLDWSTEDNKRKRREQIYGARDPNYVDYAGVLDKPVDPTSGLGFDFGINNNNNNNTKTALNQPYNSSSGIPAGGIPDYGTNKPNKVFPDKPSWLNGPTPRERYTAQDKEKFSPKVDNHILGLNRVASISDKENYDI